MRVEAKNSCHLMQISCVVKPGLSPRSVIWHQIAAVNSLVLWSVLWQTQVTSVCVGEKLSTSVIQEGEETSLAWFMNSGRWIHATHPPFLESWLEEVEDPQEGLGFFPSFPFSYIVFLIYSLSPISFNISNSYIKGFILFHPI